VEYKGDVARREEVEAGSETGERTKVGEGAENDTFLNSLGLLPRMGGNDEAVTGGDICEEREIVEEAAEEGGDVDGGTVVE